MTRYKITITVDSGDWVHQNLDSVVEDFVDTYELGYRVRDSSELDFACLKNYGMVGVEEIE